MVACALQRLEVVSGGFRKVFQEISNNECRGYYIRTIFGDFRVCTLQRIRGGFRRFSAGFRRCLGEFSGGFHGVVSEFQRRYRDVFGYLGELQVRYTGCEELQCGFQRHFEKTRKIFNGLRRRYRAVFRGFKGYNLRHCRSKEASGGILGTFREFSGAFGSAIGVTEGLMYVSHDPRGFQGNFVAISECFRGFSGVLEVFRGFQRISGALK